MYQPWIESWIEIELRKIHSFGWVCNSTQYDKAQDRILTKTDIFYQAWNQTAASTVTAKSLRCTPTFIRSKSVTFCFLVSLQGQPRPGDLAVVCLRLFAAISTMGSDKIIWVFFLHLSFATWDRTLPRMGIAMFSENT